MNTQARRIYQAFGTIEEESTVGYSQYHSFQLTVNKRFSRGFTLLAAYTFSKNIDATSTGNTAFNTAYNDQSNINASRGISDFNRPQRPEILEGSSVDFCSLAMRMETGGMTVMCVLQQTGFPQSP